MNELGVFLGKMSWRLLQHSGMVEVIRAPLWEAVGKSPAFKFLVGWAGPVTLVMILGIQISVPVSAFELARQILVKHPETADSHLQMAVAMAMASDYRLAEQEYAKAQDLLPPQNEGVLGAALRETERVVFPKVFLYQEIEAPEEHLERYPGYRDSLLILATKYWQLNELVRAKEAWEQAFMLDPNNPEVVRIGELLL